MGEEAARLVIVGGTIIDGRGGAPIKDGVICIEGRRIAAVGDRSLALPPGGRKVSAFGKYVIPGLMNANVHLLSDIRLENLVRHIDGFEDLIAEAAQVTLKNGLTTVFDTWGPRRALMAVRDAIHEGRTIGSRIFCGGNIIGFDGPYSPDFIAKTTEVASPVFVRRINAIWTENVGRHLMWLTPDEVAREVDVYIRKGVDFVKYASNEHGAHAAGAFLQFSAETQSAIVAQAHRAGLTAQAHCMTVEGLRLAIEAGCDLITHCNITGPTAIPESTLRLFAERNIGAVVFPWTERGWDWLKRNVSEAMVVAFQSSDINARNLIRSNAPLMLANDGALFAAEALSDPLFAKSWAGAPEEDSLMPLGSGHFFWFRAMEEKGCDPMRMLQAATRNIAVAYGKEKDLGSLEPGKVADLIILDKDPLRAAENYRSINTIIKDGEIVDRATLPKHPILTRGAKPPVEEEASYKAFFENAATLPLCPACIFK